MAPTTKETIAYTVSELKSVLRLFHLSSTGMKPELITRLSEVNENIWGRFSELLEEAKQEEVAAKDKQSNAKEENNKCNDDQDEDQNTGETPNNVEQEKNNSSYPGKRFNYEVPEKCKTIV